MNQMANQKRDSFQTVEQILNIIESFPKHELNQSNMKPCEEYLKINEVRDRFKAFSYDNAQGQFILQEFSLYSNLLTKNNAEFLILSSCTLESKVLKYKHMQTYGIILTSIVGQTYLFFECISKHIEVSILFYLQISFQLLKKMKNYCKQSGFLKKFTIKEKNHNNLFTCIKNKNEKGSQFIVEIYRDSDLQRNYENYEALMNEIHILMCIKDHILLPFKALYQDKNILFLLYNMWQGDTLFKLIQSGFKFNDEQKTEVLCQIVEFIKKLHFLGLSHCRLTPNNILLLKTNNQVNLNFNKNYDKLTPIKVALTHFGFKQVNYYYWKWLKEKVICQWLPPELNTKNNLQDQILSQQMVDSYQFGCLLYYLEYYDPLGNNELLTFDQVMGEYQIDYQVLTELNSKEKSSFYLIPENTQIEPENVCSRSILDLMLLLLNPNPVERFSIQLASKHQWFINQKSKFSQNHQIKKLAIDYSLRTIIELREISERDILFQKMNKIIHSQIDSDFDEYFDFQCDENNSLSTKLEQLNAQSLFSNLGQKKND